VLWIGTASGGLNQFNREKQTFRRFQSSPAVPNDLNNNEVLSIYQDRNGVLWIGTGGGGLNQFDREKETFKHYTRKQGLPNNVVYGILEDNLGNLWLSTNKGISMFNPSTGIFKNFDLRDGLQGYEFNTGAYFKSQSGQMFFGGVNGLNSFYPDRIEENQYIPPVVITEFKIYNKPVAFGKDSPLQKHITETGKIILSYKHNIFSFEFAALDFTHPGKNRYMYKMEGFNREWIHLGHKNDIAFTNLDPGEYIFRVRGANSDGIWNNEGASIKIIITPPIWKTWWFRGLIIMLVVFLAYKWHQTTMKRLSKRLKTEAAMVRFFAKYNISEGEQKILKLILKGKTNKEIEDILFISYHTVKNHIYNIYQKLEVKNRAQLINLFQESLIMKEE
jgi:DNA-binding CsgD family transcriptional regulator